MEETKLYSLIDHEEKWVYTFHTIIFTHYQIIFTFYNIIKKVHNSTLENFKYWNKS